MAVQISSVPQVVVLMMVLLALALALVLDSSADSGALI